MGTLYIVSTPIGNLQDISLRMTETLFRVDAIACEDTRRTGVFLQHIAKHYPQFDHKPRLISYFEHNEAWRIPEIISLLQNNLSVALVSDAGTPAISDPGFKLIRSAIKEGIKVEAIPGPTALISALVVSGLPPDKFLFMGYPPRKDKHRTDLLDSLQAIHERMDMTVIFYEAPHRLIKTLEDIKSTMGNIPIVVCSELTKLFEKTIRGSVEDIIAEFTKKKPRGEFVILFSTKDLEK